jgi:ferredoxin-NADP reductase
MSFSPVSQVPAIGSWQDATVVDIRPETSTIKTFRLSVPKSAGHMAGQHYVVRLTAPDGYRAQRSYSVGSPPDDTGEIELTVERLPDGEVSIYLHDELAVGDTIEVRGPIGGWFVWAGTTPALLIGGGSGVVPVMSMLRLARRTPDQTLAHLIVSVRSPRHLIYASEMTGPDTTVIYSREAQEGSARPAGRLTVEDLAPFLRAGATTYICGSTPFAEAAGELVVEAGTDPGSVRLERFGPTG